MYIKKTIDFNGDTLSIETGKLAPRANGSVVVKYKGNVILVTASSNLRRNYKKPFLALTVDFIEKLYASGKIPNGFFRREGKPSLNATLSARVIDRSIRPLFEDNFHSETHVVVNVLSYDGTTDLSVLGILGASSALMISNIPFHTPIAAMNIGYDNKPIVGANDNLDLVVAATKENIVMVEAKANEISEEEIVKSIHFAHNEMIKLIDLQQSLIDEIKPKKYEVFHKEEEVVDLKEIKEKIEDLQCAKYKDKSERIQEMVLDFIDNNYNEVSEDIKLNVEASCKEIVRESSRKVILANRERLDGRALNEVRDINIETNVLPMVHGSAFFARGQTQSLGSATLGTVDSQQLIDGLDESYRKRFFLHYNFPPFSTGEASYMRAPGRRELGHGNLAETAIEPMLPSEDKFPYTIRVVSDILSSNGSSSMASVCSASLALMSAGVPIKKAVAGVAMGLIKEDDNFAILTDITGFEDGIGDMDFKVAGTEHGITALQMDIKTDGINEEIMIQSMSEAKNARLHILSKMNEVIAKANDLSDSVPRYSTIFIEKDKISSLIGPGGKNIKEIIEVTGSEINVDDSGKVMIFASDSLKLAKAIDMVNRLTKEPKIGDIVEAKVKKVIASGAFLEITKGRDGFLHISEISSERVNNINDHVKESDILKVEVINIDPLTKKIKLKKIK